MAAVFTEAASVTGPWLLVIGWAVSTWHWIAHILW